MAHVNLYKKNFRQLNTEMKKAVVDKVYSMLNGVSKEVINEALWQMDTLIEYCHEHIEITKIASHDEAMRLFIKICYKQSSIENEQDIKNRVINRSVAFTTKICPDCHGAELSTCGTCMGLGEVLDRDFETKHSKISDES